MNLRIEQLKVIEGRLRDERRAQGVVFRSTKDEI